jgi:hypothetical protein
VTSSGLVSRTPASLVTGTSLLVDGGCPAQ